MLNCLNTAAVFGIPKAWFFNKKSNKFRIGLLGLLLAITALKLGVWLEKLKWESLKKRRRDSRLILLYKVLKGTTSIPTDDLIWSYPPPPPPPTYTHTHTIRCSRNHHSLTFQTPDARTDIYNGSFFPQSEIGRPFQIQLLPLLEVQRMVWLGLPLWWELGTNFLYHRFWQMNVIRGITSKNWFWTFF